MPDVLPNHDSLMPEEYDQYISAHIKIPLCVKDFIALVKRRKGENSGKPIGIFNDSPLINTSLYEVELPDGAVE